MPFEYLCLNEACLRNSQELCCLYCCQELHQHQGRGLDSIQALRTVLDRFHKEVVQSRNTEFKAAEILLNGVKKCRTERELRQNISEILGYWKETGRFESIIDRDNELQKQETREFYEGRNQKSETEKTIKKNKKQILEAEKNFVTPVLTFSAEEALEQGF